MKVNNDVFYKNDIFYGVPYYIMGVINSPVDKIVYDVSHQSYVHKMVTGRALAFLDHDHYRQ